jgi:23S rRNA (adenine2503-C2)-methyltransferase
MTREEIARAVADLGEPAYRAGQIATWLYRKRAGSFDEMTNLSLGLRQALKERYDISVLKRAGRARSSRDGALKYGLTLRDGYEIETVFLPHPRGATLCISSQVGCGYACKFCATGRMGLKRDLRPEEIVGQVLFILDELGDDAGREARGGTRPFGNIVLMGMGEPLANYANTMKAVHILIKEVGVGSRRITISTSGLPEEMMRLAQEPYEIGLAVSLNAATDEKRERIMPVAARVPLVKLMNAARYYHETKGRILTFEYVLMKGINDSTKDAHELASLTREVPAKINLIALNPFPGCKYERPEPETVEKFETILKGRGKRATIRKSLGSDIQAACGQLAGRFAKKKHLKNT